MNIRRALSVTKRIFLGLRNEKRTLALIFVAPVIAMFVFGLAFSGDVKDVHVVVVNNDAGLQTPASPVPLSISQKIISNFDTEVLKVDYANSEEEAVKQVQEGGAYGVIVFPGNFTRDIYGKIQNPSLPVSTTIQVRLDKSNVNVATAITTAVSNAVLKTMSDMGLQAPVNVNADNAIYAKSAKFMDFFVPGIMAFVVFLLTTLLTLITFVGERTSGNLERLQATPLRESEIVVGYAIAFSIIGMLQDAILIAIGVGYFHILIVGNIFLAFLVVALLAVGSLSLGILLSSLAKRESQAIQFFPFITLPTFLLAGIFWPVEAIPSWLRPLSYAIPPYYAVEATRSVILRGWGVGGIWLDIVALLAFAIGFLVLAVWSLQRGKG